MASMKGGFCSYFGVCHKGVNIENFKEQVTMQKVAVAVQMQRYLKSRKRQVKDV